MSRPTTRTWVNLALCLIAMGVMAFFSLCTSSCAYFRGSLFGLDLKVLGPIYMALLIVLSLVKYDLFINIALGAGLGGEVLLVAFQVRQGRYCPFCLIFGAIVTILFLINFRWSRKWPILAAVVVGYLVFLAFFKGSFIPKFELVFPVS